MCQLCQLTLTLSAGYNHDIRIVRHIESIVSERADCASALRERHPGSPEECLSTWLTEMWEILETLDVSRPRSTTPTVSEPPQPGRGGAPEVGKPRFPSPGYLDGDLGLVEDAVPSALIDSSVSLVLSENTIHPSEPPLISDSDKQALQDLISRTIPQDELPSVIERVVLNVKATDIVKYLQLGDAQAFVDVIDEVCHHPFPSLKNPIIDPPFNPLVLLVRR